MSIVVVRRREKKALKRSRTRVVPPVAASEVNHRSTSKAPMAESNVARETSQQQGLFTSEKEKTPREFVLSLSIGDRLQTPDGEGIVSTVHAEPRPYKGDRAYIETWHPDKGWTVRWSSEKLRGSLRFQNDQALEDVMSEQDVMGEQDVMEEQRRG